MATAFLSCGLNCLVRENVHNCLLKRGGNVTHALLAVTGVFCNITLHGGFNPAEAEIKTGPLQVGAWKTDGFRVAVFCEPFDDSTSRISQAQHLGNLVKGLAGRIIPGLPHQFDHHGGADMINARVSAGHQQSNKGKRRRFAL